MARTVRGLLTTLKKKFDDDEGLFQQGKFVGNANQGSLGRSKQNAQRARTNFNTFKSDPINFIAGNSPRPISKAINVAQNEFGRMKIADTMSRSQSPQISQAGRDLQLNKIKAASGAAEGLGLTSLAQKYPENKVLNFFSPPEERTAISKGLMGKRLNPDEQRSLDLKSIFAVGGLSGGISAIGGKQQIAKRGFSLLTDKKPRFEIDDSASRLLLPKDISGNIYSLKQVLGHDELYKRYPQLADTPITAAKLEPTVDAMWDGSKIVLNENFLRNPSKKTVNVLRPNGKVQKLNFESYVKAEDKVKATVLHEIQHAIQDVEGFAKGGSMTGQGVDAYKKLSGEVEARDVMARMNLTPEERVRIQPLSSQGIPVKDQIVKLQDDFGISQSSKLDPLMEEARKYKSAEEFVKAQGEPLYHGTDQKFDVFKQPSGEPGSEGIFLAPSSSNAQYYVRSNKGEVKDVYLKKDAKIWDFENPKDVQKLQEQIQKHIPENKALQKWNELDAEVDKILKRASHTVEGLTIRPDDLPKYKSIKAEMEKLGGDLGSPDGKALSDKVGSAWYTNMSEILQNKSINKWFKENYDGWKQLDHTDYGTDISIGVFDANSLKTKSQLTDIYNQATKQPTQKYLYHGTNEDVLESISKEGLRPGKTTGNVSLSPNESYAQQWAQGGVTPQGKTEGVMLRVNQDLLKTKILPSKSGVKVDQVNELISKDVIPREAIEVKINGKWKPLTDIYNQATKQDNVRLSISEPSQKIKLRSKTAPGQYTNDPRLDNPLLGSDALETVRGQIGRKPTVQGVRQSIKDGFDKFYTDWVNANHPVEKLSRKVKESGFDIPEELDSTYNIKRLFGAGGKAELRHQKKLQNIISELDPRAELDDFDVFLKAKRDIELGGRGVYGSDATTAQSAIDALAERHDISKFNDVAEKLYTYQREGLNRLRQEGIIGDDAYRKIVSANQKYVPFERIRDELDNFLGVPGAKLQQSQNPVGKIKGSGKAIEPPLESVIANTYKVEAAIAKNRVAKSIANLSNSELAGGLITKTSKSGPNTISVWENGQKVHYEVPKEISDVVKGLNEEQAGILEELASIPARIFRQQTTGRNLEFMIPNIFRDQQDAAINSKYGYKPFIGWLEGFVHLVNQKGVKNPLNKLAGNEYIRSPRNDKVVEEWMNNGGSIFFENMAGRKAISKQISDAKTKKKITRQLMDWAISGIDTVGEFSETPTRIGLYKQARRAGANIGESVLEARESSIDFARRGAKMKTLNSIIPFLNVGVQGFDKMVRSVKDNPARVGMTGMTIAGIPQIMISLYNNYYHPEEYSQVPDFEKQGNFVLMTGGLDNEGRPKYIKIPKGHVSALFANPFDHFITWYAGNNPQSFSQFALSTLTDALPVVGEGDNLKEITSRTVGGLTPQFALPTLESVLNYDTFRNRPVVPAYLQDKPPAEQTFDSTPEGYQAIGRVLNVSPLKVKKFVEGTLGGGIKQVTNLYHTLDKASKGEPLDTNQTFILRRFIGSWEGFDTERPAEDQETSSVLNRLKEEFTPGSVSASDGSEVADDLSNKDKILLYKELSKEATSLKVKQDKVRIGVSNDDPKQISQERGDTLIKLRNFERNNPEIVFEAGLETYTSGAGMKVDKRAEWVKEQLSSAQTDEEKQSLINEMWDAGVLTTGKKGTAEYLKKEFGLDVYSYTGEDKDILSSVSKGKGGKKAKIGSTPTLKLSSRKTPSVKFSAPQIKRLKFSDIPQAQAQSASRPRVNIRDLTQGIRSASKYSPQRIRVQG